MIQSMTGYGNAESEFRNKKITVEIKSLNSKQLDVTTRIPFVYRDKEIDIRNRLFQVVERGKVDISILIDSSVQSSTSKINRTAIENYYQEIKEIAQNMHVVPPSDWFSVILRLPEIIKVETTESDEGEWEAVRQTMDHALNIFVAFRKQEGKSLEKVFSEKISNINSLSKEIEKYESERIEKIKNRLADSLSKVEVKYDENRMEQEVIYYIERLDINEEKTRLNNHLSYFLETMANEKSQGRKLGFIVQEIGREINTLGSKSNHAAMQKIVVQMKDELEQVKEQILNVL